VGNAIGIVVSLAIGAFAMVSLWEYAMPAAVFVLFIFIFLLFACIGLLLKKYTLTECGLEYRSFSRKTVTYNELMQSAKTNSFYLFQKDTNSDTEAIDKLLNSILILNAPRKIRIQLLNFYGSYGFLCQLESKIGVKLERKQQIV